MLEFRMTEVIDVRINDLPEGDWKDPFFQILPSTDYAPPFDDVVFWEEDKLLCLDWELEDPLARSVRGVARFKWPFVVYAEVLRHIAKVNEIDCIVSDYSRRVDYVRIKLRYSHDFDRGYTLGNLLDDSAETIRSLTQETEARLEALFSPERINKVGLQRPLPAEIRKFILTSFSDEELDLFCADNFADVRHEFSQGMSFMSKAQRLVDYCQAHGATNKLLIALQGERSRTYVQSFGSIT